VRDGTNWVSEPFYFDFEAQTVVVENIAQNATLAFVQVEIPRLTASRDTSGVSISFTPVATWTHTLERTADFTTWTTISTLTPTDSKVITIRDPQAPQSAAFYRLRMERP
jgi:hypothetical protein